MCVRARARACVCVCVCVCARALKDLFKRISFAIDAVKIAIFY